MAADLYVQPGTCSVTAQNAICCGCPVILSSRYEGYHLFVQDNGWLVNTEDELYRALQEFVPKTDRLAFWGAYSNWRTTEPRIQLNTKN